MDIIRSMSTEFLEWVYCQKVNDPERSDKDTEIVLAVLTELKCRKGLAFRPTDYTEES